MKKQLLFFATALGFAMLANSTQAQTSPNCTLDSTTIYHQVYDTVVSTYTFNSNNQVTEELRKRHNALSNRYTYTYDANNNLTEDIFQRWDAATSTWIDLQKTTYTYNAANILLVELHQSWDNATTAWKNSFQYSYTYDATNKRTEELLEYWVSGAWETSKKTAVSYNASNQRIEDLTDTWNIATTAWEPYTKNTYAYLTNGLLNEKLYYTNPTSWKLNSKDTFEYDMYDNMKHFSYKMVDNNGVWFTLNGEINHYTCAPLSSSSVSSTNEILLYPNPANDKITLCSLATLQDATIEITSVTEQKVHLEKVVNTNSHTIDISQFPSGVYLITVSHNQEIWKQKLIKQ